MASGPGLEPYKGRDVARMLEHCGAAPMVRSQGGRQRWVLPSGVEVSCPCDGDDVPTLVARRLANSLGKSWTEFRAAVGYPVIVSGRARSLQPRQQAPGCTKRELLHRLAEIRQALSEVERAIRPGLRDSAFYLRVHEHLAETQRQAQRAVSEATTTGAPVSVGRDN